MGDGCLHEFLLESPDIHKHMPRIQAHMACLTLDSLLTNQLSQPVQGNGEGLHRILRARPQSDPQRPLTHVASARRYDPLQELQRLFGRLSRKLEELAVTHYREMPHRKNLHGERPMAQRRGVRDGLEIAQANQLRSVFVLDASVHRKCAEFGHLGRYPARIKRKIMYATVLKRFAQSRCALAFAAVTQRIPCARQMADELQHGVVRFMGPALGSVDVRPRPAGLAKWS